MAQTQAVNLLSTEVGSSILSVPTISSSSNGKDCGFWFRQSRFESLGGCFMETEFDCFYCGESPEYCKNRIHNKRKHCCTACWHIVTIEEEPDGTPPQHGESRPLEGYARAAK